MGFNISVHMMIVTLTLNPIKSISSDKQKLQSQSRRVNNP